MSNWIPCNLGDVIQLQRGFDITKREQVQGDIPIVSSSGIGSYHNRYKVKGPGVITGRKGTLGKVHYVKSNYWPHDTTLWVKDFKGNNPLFVFYFLKVMRLESYDVGASNPTLNRNHLHKLKLIFPPLPIQKKIAAILSAYDELIENNNRRIAILEKMAEEIYREWFVRMRFPGHEKMKVVKGVPEGWGVVKVKNIVVRKRFGRIYKEDDLFESGKVIVIDQSVKDYLGYYNGEPEHVASIDDPIILFGDHSCKMLLMIEPFSLAENVIPVQSKGNIPIVFLFYLIHNLIETNEYKRHWTELINKSVFLPDPKLQDMYSDKTKNLLLEKDKLTKVSHTLKQSRDLLLPRLISGKLDVEKLEVAFPPEMSNTNPTEGKEAEAA